MPINPYARSCVAGCDQPATVRGRCATHAGHADQHRGLNSDRRHLHLYQSARWRRLRQQVLAAAVFCQCKACRGADMHDIATTVHHPRPHHGDEALFFAEDNLQALAKPCHDRITGRHRRGDVKC